MKHLLVSLLLTFSPWMGLQAADVPMPVYDAQLAERLGADVYGMRVYTLVLLAPGAAKIEDQEERARLQQGHLAHIRKMAEEGHLVLAGPFLDAADLRGLFVLATEDLDKARALVAKDPAVQAGTLDMRLERWYGSAALPELTDIHARIAREQP